MHVILKVPLYKPSCMHDDSLHHSSELELNVEQRRVGKKHIGSGRTTSVV